MILLTGASGFFGKIIVESFSQNKIKVTTVGRKHENDICCDLSKESPSLGSSKYNTVIHAAGKAHSIPKNKEENKQFFDINVKGTQNLLNSLQISGLPENFVFISSVAVYGLVYGDKIIETEQLKAVDPYGASKICAEKIILDWCRKNYVCCTILRLPLLVSENPPGNLGAMLRAIRKGYYFNIGGGTAKKSMVLVSDVVRFIPLISTTGGIFNLTDGVHPSFNELSMVLSPNKKIFNLPLNFAIILGLIGDFFGDKSVLNTKKVKKITTNLTFDDSKAREFGWDSQPVLKYIKNNDL